MRLTSVLTAGHDDRSETAGHPRAANPLRTYIVEAVTSRYFRETSGAEFSWDSLQRQLGRDGYGVQAMSRRERNSRPEHVVRT